MTAECERSLPSAIHRRSTTYDAGAGLHNAYAVISQFCQFGRISAFKVGFALKQCMSSNMLLKRF